jgi:hypothetical protein
MVVIPYQQQRKFNAITFGLAGWLKRRARHQFPIDSSFLCGSKTILNPIAISSNSKKIIETVVSTTRNTHRRVSCSQRMHQDSPDPIYIVAWSWAVRNLQADTFLNTYEDLSLVCPCWWWGGPRNRALTFTLTASFGTSLVPFSYCE